MSPPPILDDLSSAQLKELAAQLLAEVSELRQIIAAQREEIARLKGLKGPPSLKPSGMEKATEPARSGPGEKCRRHGKVRPRVAVEDCILKAAPPPRSRFKGYETY